MKKIILIVGIVLAAAALSAGSFWGGMQYQISQSDQVQANFISARGQPPSGEMPSGQFPGNGQMPTDRQGMIFGGGTTGQVKSVEDNVLLLSTAQDVTTVNLTTDTVIRKTVTTTLADLQPGMRVSVAGQRDTDGNLTATQITIMDESTANLANPGEKGTTP